MTTSDHAPAYDELLKRAQTDPHILGFILSGSHGKGHPTEHSDYDCIVIVDESVLDEYKTELETFGQPLVESVVTTLPLFKTSAAWGSDEAWARYTYAYLTPTVDKTGELQKLIDEKARVPADQVKTFIAASLDHFINQVYRSIKCRRDGKIIGSRLEAAEEIQPLLNALFALHDGRLRPYYKYLEWELETRPLSLLPWKSDAFLGMLLKVLETGDLTVQQELLVGVETLFRSRGYNETFDGWEETLPWIRDFKLSDVR